MIEQRPIVTEHRLTYAFRGFSIRYWIEDDPEHGGIPERKDAEHVVLTVQHALSKTAVAGSAGIARALLEALPSANSIEVCDSRGLGTVVHRNWP